MVSLRAGSHGVRAGTRGGTGKAATQSLRASQARQAAAQVAPLARTVRMSTRQGVHNARVWAAPRVERTGQLVQERAAPRVSSMLSAAARRIEPTRPGHSRRWPVLAAGMAMLAGGGAAAAALRNRRGAFGTRPGEATPTAAEHDQAAGTGASDFERHARTT